MQRAPLVASPRLNGVWGDADRGNTMPLLRFSHDTEPTNLTGRINCASEVQVHLATGYILWFNRL